MTYTRILSDNPYISHNSIFVKLPLLPQEYIVRFSNLELQRRAILNLHVIKMAHRKIMRLQRPGYLCLNRRHNLRLQSFSSRFRFSR